MRAATARQGAQLVASRRRRSVSGRPPEPFDLLGGGRQGEVAVRPDVRAAEGHQQIDVGRPGADVANLDQPAAGRFVVDPAETT